MTVQAWYPVTMITSPESVAFERGIDSLLLLVLPEKAGQVAAFQGDQELSARIEELAALQLRL